MRRGIVAASFGLCFLLCVAGALLLSWRPAMPREPASLVSDFASTQPIIMRVSPDTFQRARATDDLVDPSMALPHAHLLPWDFFRSLSRFEKECRQPPRARGEMEEKLLAWVLHLCGARAWPPPPEFFERPPAMHPSGKSFAFLVWERLSSGEREKWKGGLAPWMHVKELAKAGAISSQTDSLLSRLSLGVWDVVRHGGPLALDDSFALVRQTLEDGAFYSIHERSVWDGYFRSRGMAWSFASRPGSLAIGNVYWPSENQEGARWRSTGLFMLASGLVGFSVLASLSVWASARSRRAMLRRRQFFLQLLTHEFRAPVTALGINLESLAAAAPDSCELSLLRLQQVQTRFSQILEASEAYLRSGEASFSEGDRVIDDLTAFLKEFCEGEIPVRGPASLALRVDPYWLLFCVGNLLSNAREHGTPPVSVEVEEKGGRVHVRIRDGGNLDREGFLRARQRFVRHEGSRGLGLGMGLVEQVVQEMGGELRFFPGPTTFEIRLPRGGSS